MPDYWIGVASRAHVHNGLIGGFAQLGHGSHTEVKALRKGDWIIYYSPKEALDENDPVQAFTAIGEVLSDHPYQVNAGNGFEPWRVDVDFRRDANEAPIRPLLETLDLTRERGKQWGMAVRRSKIKINAGDFARIARTMGIAFETGAKETGKTDKRGG